MKLINFRVTNFRNIEDSGLVTLEQVLCLVGKNESGKSSMLEALCGLNPHSSHPIVFNRERDYPRRHWLNYRKLHPEEEAVVIETHWQLESPETEAIAAYFGPDALARDQVTALRRYGSPEIEWRIPLRLRSITEFLLNDENLGYSERRSLGEIKNTRELRGALENLTAPTDKQRSLLERLRSLPGKNATLTTEQILQLMLPRFMLISDYPIMASQVRLDNWNARIEEGDPTISQGERMLVDFLTYAGIAPNESIFASSYETLNARCESASNLITQQLATSWSQNRHLDVEIRINQTEAIENSPGSHGMMARVRVKDQSNRVSVQLSERSTGLLWFFSFMMAAALLVRRQESIIMVLDEPGLTLHGAGQEDLLLYVYEYLAPHFQVIYTTHSPFMISSPDNVRLIAINPNNGCASVLSDFAAADSETLLPVQAAGVWNGHNLPHKGSHYSQDRGGNNARDNARDGGVDILERLDDLEIAKMSLIDSTEPEGETENSPAFTDAVEVGSSAAEVQGPEAVATVSDFVKDEAMADDSSQSPALAPSQSGEPKPSQTDQTEAPSTVAAEPNLPPRISPQLKSQLVTRPLLLLSRLEESLYLSSWSGQLIAAGRVGLDDRWQLCPMPESIGWMEQLSQLMPLNAAEQGDVRDLSKTGAVILRSSSNAQLPSSLPSLDLAQILKREEADIEDVFVPEFYMRLVTNAYSLQDAEAPAEDEEPLDLETTRLLPLITAAFKQIAPSSTTFRAEVPAWYLFHHPTLIAQKNDPEAEESLERAEKLIQAINHLLTTEV
ncbi:MAG: AAA family ATPase [Candidatus Pacebacteria bacterium]|nr:AAA family ATPase [Candidatus Paceibacterota bacterium]